MQEEMPGLACVPQSHCFRVAAFVKGVAAFAKGVERDQPGVRPMFDPCSTHPDYVLIASWLRFHYVPVAFLSRCTRVLVAF
jgi:hypothetical protein